MIAAPVRRVFDEATPGPPCRDCGGNVPAKLATDLHPTCGKDARELLAASSLARGLGKARAQIATTTAPDRPYAPRQASAGQLTRLGALMAEAGLRDRAAAVAYVAEQIGRTVRTRDELTAVEALALCDALEDEIQHQKDRARGLTPVTPGRNPR